MNPATYIFQSDFARHYIATGKADLLNRLLTLRFGPVDESVQRRIRSAAGADVEAIAARLLSARTLEEALG